MLAHDDSSVDKPPGKMNNQFYEISQLVRALWLDNLMGSNLLYGPLAFKAIFVTKMFRDLSPIIVLNFFSN